MPDFHTSLDRALNREHGQHEPPLTPEEEELAEAGALPEPEYCTAIVYRQTLESPAEYCEEFAEPGEELCRWHLGDE